MARLNKNFYLQKTEIIAQNLLGKILVYRIGNKNLSGIIVETEAYIGPKDKASHASRGKTERNKTMFEEAGIWYIYVIYGFYHCLNIVTGAKDYPAAVLIRAIEPKEGISEMIKNRKTDDIYNLTSGPGKLCQALNISKIQNNASAIAKSSKLHIKDGTETPKNGITRSKRIGVDYAGAWKDRLLRFFIKDNKFISKK